MTVPIDMVCNVAFCGESLFNNQDEDKEEMGRECTCGRR